MTNGVVTTLETLVFNLATDYEIPKNARKVALRTISNSLPTISREGNLDTDE